MDTHRIITVGDEYEVGFAEGKKVGIELVVDWIDANNAIMVTKDDGATMFLYVGNEWQAKLKEWGITLD